MIDGWTARHLTTRLHAISGAVKEAAVASLRLPPNRITVIERGRDRRRLGLPSRGRRREARRELGLTDQDEVVINVARREFVKGQIHLLRAVRLLRERRPRLRLLIAGRPGSMAVQLERFCEDAGIIGQVNFLGHRDDVPQLLAASDLFVLPSLIEGMAGVVIEAMALGVPVVASDLPAVREVVEAGPSAFLTPPGDSAALAVAIDRLLDDPEMARTFGERGRKTFEGRFTLDRSVARFVDLYREVASMGRSKRTCLGNGRW
jgi:glycosyltransferase involved in cell wall biosynthesis